MTRNTRTLCLLHLPANALLLWLAYAWLGVGESTLARLVWSAAVALVVLALACWLHGATFAYFRGAGDSKIGDAFRTALRNLPVLLLVVLLLLVLYGYLAWWGGYSSTPASKLASWLTLKFRKPVRPATVLRYFNAVLWMVRWVLLPVAVLPLLSGVSTRGWRGFTEYGWRRHSRLYRLEAPLLLLCGVWLPLRLMGWVPEVQGFGMQMGSFVLRIGVAYLLFVAAALSIAFLTSRGKPPASQFKTAPSP